MASGPWDELIARHVDGLLSTEEAYRFGEALASDPAAALALADAMRTDAMIAGYHRACFRRPIAPAQTGGRARAWRIGVATRAGLIAAALLLVGASAAAIYRSTLSTPETPSVAGSPPVLATITDAADVAWQSRPLRAGDEVTDADIAIDNGAVEFITRGGNEIRMIGATELRLLGRRGVHLARGTIDVRSGPGFTVTLGKGVEVVDLGTAFTVSAYTDSRSAVAVSEGRVRVRDAAGEERVLEAGFVTAIDDAGVFKVQQAGGPFDADPRLVALYRFTDADAGSGVLHNHAIRNAGRFDAALGDGADPRTVPIWTQGPTPANRAIAFNAESQRVRIADFADAKLTDEVTLAMWIKLDRAQLWHILAAQWDLPGRGTGSIHWSVHQGRLALHWMEADEPISKLDAMRHLIADKSGAITPEDGWVHVAMTMRCDGDAVLYRNGVEVGRAPVGAGRFPAAISAPMLFGRHDAAQSTSLYGAIASIAVFDAELNATDIERLYASSSQTEQP